VILFCGPLYLSIAFGSLDRPKKIVIHQENRLTGLNVIRFT
jgi:hypothetical protein